MKTESPFPRYRFPAGLVIKVLHSFIKGKRRDILQDCREISAGISPPPVFRGQENIPQRGPYLVTLNHYSRPGFLILWAAVALSAALPKSSIWLMTAAWTKRSGGLDRVITWLTHILFKRVAECYSLVTMPAMPPAPGDAAERALSIRRLMDKIRDDPEAVVCIAPEGMDFPGGVLGRPHPGTGRLLLQMARQLKRILPVGVYEEAGQLILHIGQLYVLEIPSERENVDQMVIDQVMRQIAALLPDELRGSFG